MDGESTRSVATAPSDALAGVSDDNDVADAGSLDVVEDGAHMVQLGGTVALGDFLTAGAAGKAVKCPAEGNYFGRAKQAGVADDIIRYNSALGKMGIVPNYSVSLPSGTGYTAAFVDGSSSVAASGSSVSFTVAAAEGYAVSAVSANGIALVATAGVYSIENITNDITVAVTAAAT